MRAHVRYLYRSLLKLNNATLDICALDHPAQNRQQIAKP